MSFHFLYATASFLLFLCGIITGEPDTTEHVDVTEQANSTQTVPFNECLIPKLESFVVAINLEGKLRGTGTLILPGWLVTGEHCIEETPLKAANWAGYRVSSEMVGNQKDFVATISSCGSEQIDECVNPLKVVKLSIPTPKNSPHIPIVTRTEVFRDLNCGVYAVTKDKIVHATAEVLPEAACKHGLPRGSLICATISTDECFEPCGSALICNKRLFGVRLDTKSCPGGADNTLYFLSVAFQDFAVLGQLKAQSEKGFLGSLVSGRKSSRTDQYSRSDYIHVCLVVGVFCTFLDLIYLY